MFLNLYNYIINKIYYNKSENRVRIQCNIRMVLGRPYDQTGQPNNIAEYGLILRDY